MCGIAGSLGRGSVVPGLVRALDHRGPDHAGWREDGGLAVGAARLRVTGDSRGDMPLVSSSGRTVLVVAHRLSTISTADRIVVLEAGQVVETGTYEELTSADGPFARLCRVREDVGW